MITTRKSGLAALIGVVGLVGGASAWAAPPTGSIPGRQKFVALVSSPVAMLVKNSATTGSPSQDLTTILHLEQQLLSNPSFRGDRAILSQIRQSEQQYLGDFSTPARIIREVQRFTVRDLRQIERLESALIRNIHQAVRSGTLTASQGTALASRVITRAEAQAADMTRAVLNAATASR